MSKLLPILLLFVSTSLIGQTQLEVQFKNSSQSYKFDADQLVIELQFSNWSNYNSTQPLTLEILTNEESDGLLAISSENPLQVIIEPSELKKPYPISIPINKNAKSVKNSITFQLKKKGVNADFNVSPVEHTLVLVRNDLESQKVSIQNIKSNQKITIDEKVESELLVPFKVTVIGKSPEIKDSLFIRVLPVGLKTITDSQKFYLSGNESTHYFRINNKTSDGFKKFLNELGNEGVIKLKISEHNFNAINNSEVSTSPISIKIEKKNYSLDRYDFFVGTNFDLKDKLEASSYYAEVNTLLPDLVPVRFRKKQKTKWKFGLRGGIYKNNTSKTQEEKIAQREIYEITETRNDSIFYSKKRSSQTPNVSVENLGLYFNILLRLTDPDQKFAAFAATHVEVIERKEKIEYNYTDLFLLKRDSVSMADLDQDISLQNSLARPNNFTRKYYDSYYGLGFPMFYNNTNQDFEVFLYPLVGFGSPGLYYEEKNTLKSFGVFQFHLQIGNIKGLGIKLGGEVRKYFTADINPLISVNLSTRIDLASLFSSKDG